MSTMKKEMEYNSNWNNNSESRSIESSKSSRSSESSNSSRSIESSNSSRSSESSNSSRSSESSNSSRSSSHSSSCSSIHSSSRSSSHSSSCSSIHSSSCSSIHSSIYSSSQSNSQSNSHSNSHSSSRPSRHTNESNERNSLNQNMSGNKHTIKNKKIGESKYFDYRYDGWNSMNINEIRTNNLHSRKKNRKLKSLTNYPKMKKHKKQNFWKTLRVSMIRCMRGMSMNLLVRCSFVFWIIAQSFYMVAKYSYDDSYWIIGASDAQFEEYVKRNQPELSQEDIDILHRKRQKAAMLALDRNHIPKKIYYKGRPDTEKLPADCIYSKWQMQNLPNCNLLHEIDLKIDLGMSRFGPKLPDLNGENHGFEQGAYVGSGLWRNVWKIKGGVLKMMKMEHDVNTRNFDRHRRDALVMEQYTSHPNIVSLYGFCGNTVLTQYVGRGLDELLLERSNLTAMKRIEVALDVARGLSALHYSHSTPIIHADIQSKQFLIDESNDKILLNDFNRCRFMAHHNMSNLPCLVKIPSAPGSSRSPEEYNKEELGEKIDIFSLANIFYTLLTGKKPFFDKSGQTKQMIVKGQKPFVDHSLIIEDGDKLLLKLMYEAYTFDPKKRISSNEIVTQLENFVNEST